jgi:hypothetical protein
MLNYGYHLARLRGRITQTIYERLLPRIIQRKVNCADDVPVDVFAYSGRNRLAEQVASIRSFLKNAGRPNRFVVVSDGTHSAGDIELLRRVDECVSIEQIPVPAVAVPASFESYLHTHPTGKQLALIMSLPRHNPALYIDSDVLFFGGAREFGHPFDDIAPAYYLEDCGFAGDDRLLYSDDEKAAPVNTGVLLIRGSIDWSEGIERFAELKGEPNFFTNQTLTHLVMHANGAHRFDPSKYVLQLDDQFIYADRYADPGIVLRHYVDPVRHKFWNNLGC